MFFSVEHFQQADSIVMVGIAGGVPCPDRPEDHVRLGDIVGSDKRGVVQYDMVKLKEIRACPIPACAKLVEAVRLLAADELAVGRPWDRHIGEVLKALKSKRPLAATDFLHATDDPDKRLKHPRDTKRKPGLPRVFLGPIASAVADGVGLGSVLLGLLLRRRGEVW